MQPAGAHIPKRTAVWVTLAVLAVLTSYLALRIVGPYLEALLAGAALATLFFPLYLRLQKGLQRPSLAALFSTILVVITVVLPLAFAVTALIGQLQQGPGEVLPLIESFASRLGIAPETLRSRLEEASATLLRSSLSAVSAAGGSVIQFIVAMGAFHVSLLHGPWLQEQILLHSPLGRTRTGTLLDTIQAMVKTSFYGVIAVAAAQGTLLGIGAWIAGLPAPAVWGLVTMFVSVLPVVGSALVWIPGSILLLSQGKIGTVLFFLAWSAGLVANADNVVRPLIVMSQLPVNGLLVFVALLGGLQAFGLSGIFIGPLTLAIGIALLRMLREEVQAFDGGS